jgi:hypothetical protein
MSSTVSPHVLAGVRGGEGLGVRERGTFSVQSGAGRGGDGLPGPSPPGARSQEPPRMAPAASAGCRVHQAAGKDEGCQPEREDDASAFRSHRGMGAGHTAPQRTASCCQQPGACYWRAPAGLHPAGAQLPSAGAWPAGGCFRCSHLRARPRVSGSRSGQHDYRPGREAAGRSQGAPGAAGAGPGGGPGGRHGRWGHCGQKMASSMAIPSTIEITSRGWMR